MSETLSPRYAPYTFAELEAEGWIARVRDAIIPAGQAVRGGSDLSIEAQCITQPDKWLSIMLPNGGTKLASTADQLATLEAIWKP